VSVRHPASVTDAPDSWLAPHHNGTVIITMIPMWMMQVAVNQVVKVTAVGNALM
jgi:hypothetical protein